MLTLSHRRAAETIDEKSGSPAVSVGHGRGGLSVMPPQQRKIIDMSGPGCGDFASSATASAAVGCSRTGCDAPTANGKRHLVLVARKTTAGQSGELIAPQQQRQAA